MRDRYFLPGLLQLIFNPALMQILIEKKAACVLIKKNFDLSMLPTPRSTPAQPRQELVGCGPSMAIIY
ncbi:hypothetical protein JYQ62_30070 [Nostoc sp. UHCC 0702]|nr:hypothetical protein JYQ62_30070 [Nostoc sp. UHCC 0702]